MYTYIVDIQLYDNAIRAVSIQQRNEIEWQEYGTIVHMCVCVFVSLYWQIE